MALLIGIDNRKEHQNLFSGTRPTMQSFAILLSFLSLTLTLFSLIICFFFRLPVVFVQVDTPTRPKKETVEALPCIVEWN